MASQRKGGEDVKQLQAEHAEWLAREYPRQEAWMPASGMVEEAGELLHALVQRGQEVLHGKHPRYSSADWQLELEDAVGDCALYVCSLCNTLGWDFAGVVRESHALEGGTSTLDVASELVVQAVNVVRDTTLRGAIDYLCLLRTVASRLSVDFDRAVRSTWARVKLRQRAEEHVPTVALIGSSRFKAAFQRIGEQLEKGGELVLAMTFFQHADGVSVSPQEREVLRRVDRRRLQLADRVVAVDEAVTYCTKCNKLCERACFAGFSTDVSACCMEQVEWRPYIGEDTRIEIEYVESIGKRVSYASVQ
jgi:NTP pyrophosphatase (non-canonical NTP hydrolase)